MKNSLAQIRALIMDVDGVMTDGRIFMDSSGEWRRFFHILDGVGIKRLQQQGYVLGVITGSRSRDIQERVKNLGIEHFYEGYLEKIPAFEDFLKKSQLHENQVAYIGDDYFDIPILKRVGFAATVPSALSEVIDQVGYTTQRQGGAGAIREICDLIFEYGAFAVQEKASSRN